MRSPLALNSLAAGFLSCQSGQAHVRPVMGLTVLTGSVACGSELCDCYSNAFQFFEITAELPESVSGRRGAWVFS